jgi:antitoxin component HigA of HigAB toxin-antitoxin module
MFAPTRLMVATDPEGEYFAPDKVEKTRTQIINEIKSVLKAQGAKTTDDELEELVEIRTWSQSCYEFAHFTNEELADGIAEVHTTCNGWSRDELIAALAYWCGRGKDVKRVWESGKWDPQLNRPSGKWAHKVSKVKLAHALWPVLERKIQQAKVDEAALVPEIVEVVQRAYWTAQRWRYQSFVLTAEGAQS